MIFLQARQSVLFTALVQGVPSQNVQWSISPNMGSIVNGFYTAPASNGSDTQVTITATNLIDSSMTATATVMLGQPFSTPVPPPSNVSISVAPSAATLTPGQTAQFTATVQGANYDGVLWSVTPNLGSVFNGLYTAPATITSPQTVTLNAVSAADPTQSATASITLQPVANVTISLSPGNASLNGGQSTTFTPTVSGTSNTAVTWSLNPQVGTVANGVYQAPGIIPSLDSHDNCDQRGGFYKKRQRDGGAAADWRDGWADFGVASQRSICYIYRVGERDRQHWGHLVSESRCRDSGEWCLHGARRYQ
jgi:hypothetical protein